MNPPLVSVVIPCYRQARFLSAALESVFAQTYNSIETIVVNDGSDDDTETVATGFGDRVRYIWKPNGGPSTARNLGLREASGDYVVFLDGDDLLHADSLRILVDAVRQAGCDMAVMGYLRFTDVADIATATPKLPRAGAPVLPDLFSSNLSAIHAYLTPTRLLRSVGGFDESQRACEDWDLWLRLALAGATLVTLPFAGAYYRESAGSLTSDKAAMHTGGQRILFRACDEAEKNAEIRDRWGSDIVQLLQLQARVAIARGFGDDIVLQYLRRMKALLLLGVDFPRSVPRKFLDRMLGIATEVWIMRYFKLFDSAQYSAYCADSRKEAPSDPSPDSRRELVSDALAMQATGPAIGSSNMARKIGQPTW